MLESDLSTFGVGNRAGPHSPSGSTPTATTITTATLRKKDIRGGVRIS